MGSRSQKVHITDTDTTPILSTQSESSQLAALSQALVTSNSAVAHLGLGKINGVHARYMNGEVLQTAKLEGKTGVIATVTGREVRRSIDVERLVDVIHGALEGNGVAVDGQSEETRRNGEDRGKQADQIDQWDALGSG
jgi:hypothetical protein